MRIQTAVTALFFFALSSSIGCPPGENSDPELEGDDAGECDDGVDNDQDGLTDCDDDGCENATACTGDDDFDGDDDAEDDDSSADDDMANDDDTSVGCSPCKGAYVVLNEHDLAEVAQCESISEGLDLSSAAWLDSLDLPCLASVGADLDIEYNEALAFLDMPSLESVGGRLYFEGNGALTDLDGFPSLTTVGGDLWIFYQVSLARFSLHHLASVDGALVLYQNASLTSVEIPNLTAVGGDLWISHNASLASLAGFATQTTVGGALLINGNDCLRQSEAEAFAASIEVQGAVDVYDNGANYPCN